MKINKTVLDNGLTVKSIYVPNKKNLNVAVNFNVGSNHEAAYGNYGISHFLEHMMFKGTNQRSYKQISLDVEKLGANMNACTSTDFTEYYISGLSKYLENYLDILSDVTLNSVFDDQEINKEKNVVTQEIHGKENNLMYLAYRSMLSNTFPDSRLTNPVIGYIENVMNFTRDELINWHQKYYNANNATVLVTGDVDHDHLISSCNKYFSNMNSGNSNNDIYIKSYNNKVNENIHRDDRPTCSFIMLYPSLRSDKFNVQNTVNREIPSMAFGEMMTSPLFDKVREQRGLVYGVGSHFIDEYDVSNFMINGETTYDKMDELIDTVDEICNDLEHNITEETIEAAKNSYKYRLSLVNDNISQLLSILRNSEKVPSMNDYFVEGRIETYIDGIDYNHVIDVLRDTLNSKRNLVICGNVQ